MDNADLKKKMSELTESEAKHILGRYYGRISPENDVHTVVCEEYQYRKGYSHAVSHILSFLNSNNLEQWRLDVMRWCCYDFAASLKVDGKIPDDDPPLIHFDNRDNKEYMEEHFKKIQDARYIITGKS